MNFSIIILFLITIIPIFGQTTEDSNSQDCQNLMNFFNSYIQSVGHQLNIPACCDDSKDYHYIVCENGSVTAIELRMNRFNEQIDFSNFPILPNLRKILFEGHIFKDGVLPSRFFDLPKLEDLEILSSNIAVVPENINKDCPLHKLNLYNNTINGFPNQILDYDLKFLDLSRNEEIKTIPSKIKNLKNLEILYIGMTGLTSMSEEIFNLENLREFDLDGNPELSTKIYNFGKKLDSCDFRNTNIICYEPGTCDKIIVQEEPFRKFNYDNDNTFEKCTDTFKGREEGEGRGNGSFIKNNFLLIILIIIILLLLACICFLLLFRRKNDKEKTDSKIGMSEEIYSSPTIEIPNSYVKVNSSNNFAISKINSISSDMSLDLESSENVESKSLFTSQLKNKNSPSLSPSEFNISSIPNVSSDNKFSISSIPNVSNDNKFNISTVPITSTKNKNFNLSFISSSTSTMENSSSNNNTTTTTTTTNKNNNHYYSSEQANFSTSEEITTYNSSSEIPNNSAMDLNFNSSLIPESSALNKIKNQFDSSLIPIPNTSAINHHHHRHHNRNSNNYGSESNLNLSTIPKNSTLESHFSISSLPNLPELDEEEEEDLLSLNHGSLSNMNTINDSGFDPTLNISSMKNISGINSYSLIDSSMPKHATKNLEVYPNHRFLDSPNIRDMNNPNSYDNHNININTNINTNTNTNTDNGSGNGNKRNSNFQFNMKPSYPLRINTVTSTATNRGSSSVTSLKPLDPAYPLLSPKETISSNVNMVTPTLTVNTATTGSRQSVMQNLADLDFVMDESILSPQLSINTSFGNDD
jgi:hypothetical protein